MPDHRILITGANSGLGYSTCCRLIDEFLATKKSPESLHLIFTTRDQRKNDETLRRLQHHVRRTVENVYGTDPRTASIREVQQKRVELEGELTDLCSLSSIKQLAHRLVKRGLHLDVVILNAGIGGWKGMNYPQAFWQMTFNLIEAVTRPSFKIGNVGRVVKRQLGENDVSGASEPPLGETFTANVFGHYLLAHWIAPLLNTTSGQSPSRILWISSIEARGSDFSLEDLQALTSNRSYESSKRLTDLLTLTSELPTTQTAVSALLSDPSAMSSATQRPKMYVSHPGVCVTSIDNLSPWLYWAKVFTLYVVRWLGSPWHPIQPYVAAVSAVWLALASAETLQNLEDEGGKGKWGAATDRRGNERVVRTQVDGWGYGGKVGERADGIWRIEPGRGQETKVSEGEVKEFEVLGGKAWAEMEALRKEWEKRLDR